MWWKLYETSVKIKIVRSLEYQEEEVDEDDKCWLLLTIEYW